MMTFITFFVGVIVGTVIGLFARINTTNHV